MFVWSNVDNVRSCFFPYSLTLHVLFKHAVIRNQAFDFGTCYIILICAGCPKLGLCRTAGDVGDLKVQWQVL